MTKKKTICHYELLCLINKRSKNKEKYEKMVSEVEDLSVEVKDWQPAHKIKQLETGSYVFFRFTSARQRVHKLQEGVLQTAPKNFLNRYSLINLTDEGGKKVKIKNKKDVKQD